MKLKIMILIIALTCSTVFAQEAEQKPIYTRVAVWGVERGQTKQFIDQFAKYRKPVYDKLLKDGVLTDWGLEEITFHKPEGMTHVQWWSYRKHGDHEKVKAAFKEAAKKRGEEEIEKATAQFASMVKKHRDYYIKTKHIKAAASNYEGAVYRSFSVTVKTDHGKDFNSYYQHRIKPVYQKLLDDGVLISYGLFVDELTMDKRGSHEVWAIAKDLNGLDAIDAAFDKDWGDMEGEDRRARWSSIKDIVELDTFKEYMSTILMGGTQAVE